jgi:hypothetical protein
MQTSFAIAFVCTLFVPRGWALSQQGVPHVDPSRLQALYDDLKSDDDKRCELATLVVLRDPDVLAQPETKERLVELLERFNQLIQRNFVLGPGMPEGWDETFLGPVIEAIRRLYADSLSRRAFLALARTAYNPDSPLAKSLGQLGRPFLKDMLELVKVEETNDAMTASYLSVGRQNGIAVLTHLLDASDKAKPPLKAEECSLIMARITSAASDPAGNVRWEVSQSLARVGDASAIPLLEEMARKETGPYYREQMPKELAKLRQRVAVKK